MAINSKIINLKTLSNSKDLSRLIVFSSILLFLILASYSVFACGTECETNDDCADGLYCNGQELCIDGFCVAGDPIDCSVNDLPEIATCTNNPDCNPRTWDYALGFTSVCDECSDSCTKGSYSYKHTCDVVKCGADCVAHSDCKCPSDGCVGVDWYDYPDYGICLSDCTCDLGEGCFEPCHPTVYEEDERCFEPPTTTTTTTTTIPTTTTTIPTTTTTVPPGPPGDGEEGPKQGGAAYGIKSCVINGICESWENPQMCPSDCPTVTTTEPGAPTTTTIPSAAVCGNNVCEEGENFLNCPGDCIEISPEMPTTTMPQPLFDFITGMFVGVEKVHLYFLIFLLGLMAIVLGIIRYVLLPRTTS